jgi:hypothetical protein
MLSPTDAQLVRRCLADAILHAAPRRGARSITLSELAREHAGPRATLVGHALRTERGRFMQELLNALHELTGNPKWAKADPAEYLHNFAYYSSRIAETGKIRQIPATIEFKRWPMTAKARLEEVAA